MSINTLLTILDPSASPQTGVGDGDSQVIQIGPIDSNRGGADTLYPILISAEYSGGSATLTPSVCNDPSESPRRWVPIEHLQDSGDDVAITRTATFNIRFDLPAGALLKWVVSASGSPIPNITMTARGVLRGVA